MVVVVLAAGVHLVVGELNLDLDGIAAQIADAEAKTSGEIVCVLAKQSDDYKYIPVLWAAFAALAVPLLFLIYEWLYVQNGWQVDGSVGLSVVYFVQLCVFLVAFIAVQWKPLKFMLIPKSVKLKRARRVAVEAFMAQEIHLTDERTGVLLFISLGERYAEVIADHGIYSELDDAVWQTLIDGLIADIKADRMSDGIIGAVGEIGKLLAAHFPATGENKNELPNHLIILD